MKNIANKNSKAILRTTRQVLVLSALASSMLLSTVEAGFSVNNGLLLDKYNNPFVMRGVNHAHTWYENETPQALQDIVSVGANSVRVVLSNGEQTEGWGKDSETAVTQIITQMKSLNMVSVL